MWTMLVAFGVVAWGCSTPPVAGNVEAGTRDAGPADPLEESRWAGTRISVGFGDIHNVLPEEVGAVRSVVNYRREDITACFEQPVRRRGCRTAGIPKSVEGMLMIDREGKVDNFRITQNKNELPAECKDAVNCVQTLFAGVPVPGISRFGGSGNVFRQAVVRIDVWVPSDEDLRIRMEEGPRDGAP